MGNSQTKSAMCAGRCARRQTPDVAPVQCPQDEPAAKCHALTEDTFKVANLMVEVAKLSKGSLLPQASRDDKKGAHAQRDDKKNFPVFVRTLTGTTKTLLVCGSDSVWYLKIQISKTEGIPVDQMRLIFRGKQIDDEHTLSEYGIQRDDTLNLVLGLRGGSLSMDVFLQLLPKLGHRGSMGEFLQRHPIVQLDSDTGEVSMFPVKQMMPGSEAHCCGWLEAADVPGTVAELENVVRRYTDESLFYILLNIALAIDYAPFLETESKYIRKLCFCVETLPGYAGLLRRGVDLSDVEVTEMKKLGSFVIPSFVSASRADAGGAYRKNTLLVIDSSDGERLTLDAGRSPFKLTKFSSENEVLIRCNARFDVSEVVEPLGKVSSSNPRVIRLKLLDPLDEHEELLKTYTDGKYGRWKAVFEAMDGNPHKASLLAKYFKPTSGWTLLHQAAWWGDQKAADSLVSLGFTIDRVARHGTVTPQQVKNARGAAIDWPAALAFAPKS